MRLRLLSPLAILVLAPIAGRPVHAQETVAKVKAAPQDYRGRQIRLEGEVIELHALSPRSARGMYRMVDESDRRGLLVRTNDLPETGGPFRIRARLSPELLADGTLLLDEIERDAARSPMLPLAGLIGGGGLLMALASLGMYLRARRHERHMHLGPPMWLIPTGKGRPADAPEADTAGTPDSPAPFNYRLQYIEEERSAQFERRKRQLLGALAMAGGIGVAGSGWFITLQREDAARPSFVLLTATPVESAPAPTEAEQARPDDTLRVGLLPPAAPQASPRTTVFPPPAPGSTPTSPNRAAAPRPVADSARRQVVAAAPPQVRDTARPGGTDTAPTAAPPPPPPPPPPPQEEPRAIPPVAPPPPDPEVMRRAATAELSAGIQRLVSAVNARQMGVAAGLYSPAPAEARRRERFLDFIREFGPTVSVERSDAPTMAETSAESVVTLQFVWRGDFGVDRRKSVRLSALARRDGDRWAFAGARLLENLP